MLFYSYQHIFYYFHCFHFILVSCFLSVFFLRLQIQATIRDFMALTSNDTDLIDVGPIASAGDGGGNGDEAAVTTKKKQGRFAALTSSIGSALGGLSLLSAQVCCL